MPLTTRHVDGRRIDSTDDQQWTEVHRANYDGLFCPECRHPMGARDGCEVPRRIRHFAHRPGSPTCSFGQGESEEHRNIKVLVARAVRDLTGWTAEIEYPGDGWRADVLAISPSGERRIAFEPQLSYIHPEKARERTERHAASNVETVWLDSRMRSNLEGLPRVRLHLSDLAPRVAVWALESAAYRGGTAPPIWGRQRPQVDRFVRDVCLGTITYEDGFWASLSHRADEARLRREAWEARKRRDAEQQAQAERARLEREASRLAGQRAEAERWERGRAHREAEAAKWRAEDEARAVVDQQRTALETEKRRIEDEAAAKQLRRDDARSAPCRTQADEWAEADAAERASREEAAEKAREHRAAEWSPERIRALMAETRSREGW